VLAYGAFAWRVSLQAAKEMTPERIAERIQVADEPRPSAQTAGAAGESTACSTWASTRH